MSKTKYYTPFCVRDIFRNPYDPEFDDSISPEDYYDGYDENLIDKAEERRYGDR